MLQEFQLEAQGPARQPKVAAVCFDHRRSSDIRPNDPVSTRNFFRVDGLGHQYIDCPNLSHPLPAERRNFLPLDETHQRLHAILLFRRARILLRIARIGSRVLQAP